MMTIKRSVYILDGKYDINIYSVYYSMFYEKYDIEDYIYISVPCYCHVPGKMLL